MTIQQVDPPKPWPHPPCPKPKYFGINFAKKNGWIAVDMDGVLTEYNGWNGGELGRPIPLMIERVRGWLDEGIEVRIFTSRCGKVYPDQVESNCRQIQLFCITHFKRLLQITNEKDQNMIAIFDDNAIQMIKNTGLTLQEYWSRGMD